MIVNYNFPKQGRFKSLVFLFVFLFRSFQLFFQTKFKLKPPNSKLQIKQNQANSSSNRQTNTKRNIQKKQPTPHFPPLDANTPKRTHYGYCSSFEGQGVRGVGQGFIRCHPSAGTACLAVGCNRGFVGVWGFGRQGRNDKAISIALKTYGHHLSLFEVATICHLFGQVKKSSTSFVSHK